MKDEKLCMNCKWWDTEPLRNLVSEADYENQPDGACRRYAPSPKHNIGDTDERADWPYTYSSSWCGDFISRPVINKTK